MKKIIIIVSIVILLSVLSQAQSNCNLECIKQGYSYGQCTPECESEITIPGASDCPKIGQAVLVIGTEAINKYKDAEYYIGEDKDNPKWAWIIKNLKTKASTLVRDTSDDTQHSGPIIGIKNVFLADTLTSTPIKAAKIGEKFCLPDNYACIEFSSLTSNTYATYEISKTTVDLTTFNSSWSSKAAIHINSLDDANGLNLQTSGYDHPVASGTTDKIWIINNGSSNAGIFYEDSTNTKKLAGYINMNSGSDDINIADINYKNTANTNIQIDLRGDFGTANNLDLVLDILGEEGSASTNSNDDITMNLMHTANNDFQGFGTVSSSAEDADLLWSTTQIGKKEVDLRSLYGIIIKNPKTSLDSDKVIFDIPDNQVYANIKLTGSSKLAPSSRVKNQTTVIGELAPTPILASELIGKENHNIVFVGGPCANPLVEKYDEFPKCNSWNLNPGQALIKLTKNGKNTAMLVAGTTAQDTRMASKFIQENFTNIKIEGKTIILENNKIKTMTGDTWDIDFSDYPYPFLQNGMFGNTLFVFGDKAKSDDTIGASDIISGLMSITRNFVFISNVTEDYKETAETTEKIPLGNSIGDTNYFSKLLDYGSIQTLRSEKIHFNGEDYNTRDIVMLYSSGPSMETSLSSSDFAYKSDVIMELSQAKLRYYLVFDEEIDLSTVSNTNPLDIKFLNSEITITAVDTTEITSQSATRYFMDIQDSVKIDNNYIKLIDIGKTGEIMIDVNVSGNLTKKILTQGQRTNIGGVDIKNIDTYRTGSEASCCCTDLLSFLK